MARYHITYQGRTYILRPTPPHILEKATLEVLDTWTDPYFNGDVLNVLLRDPQTDTLYLVTLTEEDLNTLVDVPGELACLFTWEG